jgi:transposase-like protein
LDGIYHPVRSGYIACDGVWFSYGKEEIVLLVAFDPESFDIIAAAWRENETQEGYETILTQAVNKIQAVNVKGLYADGDNGFMAAWKNLLPTVPFQLCVFHKELRMGQIVPIRRVSTSTQMTNSQKHDMKVFQLLFREVIYAKDKQASFIALKRLKAYVKSDTHSYPERFQKAYRSLIHNFSHTLTHFDHPHMRRDNNLVECFNGCLKPRLRLMKSFKKRENLDRYLKLFLQDYRFHVLRGSSFKERRTLSPLGNAHVQLPKYFNFMKLLREELGLHYVAKKPL